MSRVLLSVVFAVAVCVPSLSATAQSTKTYISFQKERGAFPLSSGGTSAPLHVGSNDYPGVLRVAKHLQADIERVTNAKPALSTDGIPSAVAVVLIGTIGESPVIDQLVRERKLDVADIAGKWETFLLQVVENPLPDVARALVIAGSDKRGTIFGMYDLAAKIGVSPWHYWADVPIPPRRDLYVLPGRHTEGEPKVKYRGIFINDENPALFGWVNKTFGGFNHRFYETVFDLILRMKGNFLWPAMWGKAFYDDDPANPQLADEYGIVIGTSHHEPMMRAHIEWERYGRGPWNYGKNDSVLREFWKEGIRRMGSQEGIVTLAMRGDGDEPMSAEADIALLERIVRDQRQILTEMTGRDVKTIPQVWALYKEVQDYYDKGMRTPDDVTLLLCDDNWGNIRRLPGLTDKPHAGGYGIYYHYDFVGGPRNYKWLNTTQIERVWEQMHLAYRYGADRIWIVNVGDIKPMEFPTEFFLDFAWDPERWPLERLPEYSRLWAERQFGSQYAGEIAAILDTFTKFSARRKPEMLGPGTYSLLHYREAETVLAEYKSLAEKAQRLYHSISAEYKDAFFQLVLHPVLASANLHELYDAVARNRLYAGQGRAATNSLAEKARSLFLKDSLISLSYNKILANGKWTHMMDQTHLGYTSWQQPDWNAMPEVREIEIPEPADMGVAIEGSEYWWPFEKGEAVLPECDPYLRQPCFIELFNRGRAPFEYTVEASVPWVRIDRPHGRVETECRVWVDVDWPKAPTGRHRIPITIIGPTNSRVVVHVIINNPAVPKPDQVIGFVESNGYISMEAENFTRSMNSKSSEWKRIPNLGRTSSAMTTFPVTAPSQTPVENGKSPLLEYQVHLFTAGEVKVHAYLSPTLNFHNTEGLRYAVSIDGESPQIVNIHEGERVSDRRYPQWWNQAVSNNIRIKTSRHRIDKPGGHVLKFWMVDPAVLLQKIVVETGDVKPSYLGPPESYRGIKNGVGSSR